MTVRHRIPGSGGGKSTNSKIKKMEIELIRQYHRNGVNGVLYARGGKIGETIELPWRNNMRRVSCIPEGRYKLRKRYTVKFGWHCWVENVPGRDGILIHAFNDALQESKGCIAPVSVITGEGKGTFSKAALKKLMDFLEPAFNRNEPIYLTVSAVNASSQMADNKKSSHEHSKKG